MQENKIDRIAEDIVDVKITLAELAIHTKTNTEHLAEHMKRTRAAERRLDILEGIWYAMCVAGALLLGLHTLGILEKLF